jgi:hypothetical protein
VATARHRCLEDEHVFVKRLHGDPRSSFGHEGRLHSCCTSRKDRLVDPALYVLRTLSLIDKLTSPPRLDVPGMFAGISGLMSLVVQHLDNVGVRKLTIAFYSIIGIGVLIFLIGMCRGVSRKAKSSKSEDDKDGEKVWYWGIGGFGFSFTLFTILAAFYGDWALGMLVHNLVGLPSGDSTGLYWGYWLAKRLTLFSW